MTEPFAGTAVEPCIKQAFVQEYALKFDGKLELPYTLKLEPGTPEHERTAQQLKIAS